MDTLTSLLRGLGIFMIIVGICGIGTGLYALKVVHTHDIEKLSTQEIKQSITENSEDLKGKKSEIENSLTGLRDKVYTASQNTMNASESIKESSLSIAKASSELSLASTELSEASNLNNEAADYLNQSAQLLKNWATNYDINGKYEFRYALDSMITASQRLKESSIKLNDTANKLEDTAESLSATSVHLNDTSIELAETGSKLQESSQEFESFKNPVVGILSNTISTLEDWSKSIDSASGVFKNTKKLIYGMMGYFILIHFIILALGIALIAIEINLRYPA